MEKREHYLELSQEETKHVDSMYELMIGYARENHIPVAYDEREEKLVEAVAEFFVASKYSV